MGMLRTLAGGGATPNPIPDVLHVHCARHADDVIFGAELRALPQRLPGYRLYERHTRRDGRLTPAHLHELCPDWPRRPTWACGPTGMLTDLEAHWTRAGARERLHVERFAPTLAAAPDIHPGADGGIVSFIRTGHDAAAPAGTPLLAVGEQAGVAMPSGCRMGICFSCVAPLRRGQVRDLRTGRVHGEEGDLIQTCISGAAGPCDIDL
jgi:stearoyl-CoA 9-desaturase NADPH oxidoreductase